MRENSHNTPQFATPKRLLKPRALTTQEKSAIDLLITGATDGEVADALNLDRGTIWRWRHHNPIFMAELERARAEIWRAPQEKLRGLMLKAVQNIAELVEAGDYDACVELLKIPGMSRGLVNHIGEQRPENIFESRVEQQLAAEQMPGKMDDLLIRLDDSPEKRKREQEIRAELMAEYGEDGESSP